MGMYAVVVRSEGWPGAPGFNTLHFEGLGESGATADSAKADAAASLVRGFLTGIATGVSVDVTMSIESDVVVRDTALGSGIAVFRVTETDQDGTAAGELQSSPTMICANWRTGTFGPSGRGRSFLPPTSEVHNVAGGQPSQTLKDDIQAAQDAFIAAAAADLEVDFVVWQRPKFDDADPPNLIENGEAHEVTSGFPKDTWAVLRSRRD